MLEALAECDRRGRDGFMHEYGYGKRTRYALVYHGKRYDPNAILGVAHGLEFPEEGPLHWKTFNGGAQTNDILRRLGFDVIVE